MNPPGEQALNRVEGLERHARRAGRLRQTNAQIEQAIYALVHDLREPLRQIGTQTQFLMRRLKPSLDEESAAMFGSVMAGVDYMRAMIDATLELGEKVHGSVAVILVDTRAVMKSVLQNLPVRETRTSVHIGLLPPVAASQNHVQHIFQNLLGNAIKYRSARPLEIQVDASREKNIWVFSVRDNGIGIDPDDYGRIFEMFRRGRNNAVREGNGLGLATCRSIVERYNGRIWVESAPGEGSTFFFTLPAVPTLAQEGKTEPAIRSSSASGQALQ